MRSRLWLLVSIMAVISQAACRGDGSQGRRALEPCLSFPKNAAPPNLVRATYAPIIVRLPDGFTESRARDAIPSGGQGWVAPGGLVVNYRLHAERVPMREAWSGDRGLFSCSERIGGRIATVQMVYSESTTASGQYVTAQWELGSGKTLVVSAFHPQASHRAELLSIVRSVSFENPAP